VPTAYKEENLFKASKVKSHIGYYLPKSDSRESKSTLLIQATCLTNMNNSILNFLPTMGQKATHRLFGYPYQIQGDLRNEWTSDNYELLFQICCSYENYNDRFSEAIIYFGADKQDLLNANFDNAVWTMQTT
jgi:hypothetical protein